MTEQTKKLNKSQLKRWKTALKEAAKINRILKTNKDVILYDTSCNDIITVPFSLIRSDNISTLCFVIGKTIFSYGDNNPEADNGIMYNSIEEIKDTFKCFKIYKGIKKMKLNKIKKSDLYIILEEIQKEIFKEYNISRIIEKKSEYYGIYNLELTFIYDYSSKEKRKISQKLFDEFKNISFGFKEIVIKEFPLNYPKEIIDFYGGEVIGVYISNEKLNNLPVNDDLRLARFLYKNKNIILELIK